MTKSSSNKKIVQDERVTSQTNAYAAKAFLFLAYYLVISVVVKGFTIDFPFFLYWDTVLVMALAGFYIIYRSAQKGVPVTPTSAKLIDTSVFKGFGLVSVVLGFFVIFFAVPKHDKWPAYFPGFTEKIIGALVIGFAFFILMTVVLWLIDYIPTKLAFKKSKELTGDEEPEEPLNEFVHKAQKITDERTESTIETYAAHGFYVLFSYILFSTLIKTLTLDIPMLHYYDAFIAAILAGTYFTFKTLRAGIFITDSNSKSQKFNLLGIIIGSMIFGFLMVFVGHPSSEYSVSDPVSILSQLSEVLLLATIFGFGMYLFGKLYHWYANRNAEQLVDGD